MAECIHVIPGRIRYRIPALRHSPTVAEALRIRLADSPGVRQVEIKRQAASLIVHFDPVTLETDALHHLVLGHVPPVPPAPRVSSATDNHPTPNTAPCRTRQAIRYVSGVAGAAALNALLERAVKAGIGVVLRSARIPI